jgi:hypothetical protein
VSTDFTCMPDSIGNLADGGKAVNDAPPRQNLKRHELYTGFFSAQGPFFECGLGHVGGRVGSEFYFVEEWAGLDKGFKSRLRAERGWRGGILKVLSCQGMPHSAHQSERSKIGTLLGPQVVESQDGERPFYFLLCFILACEVPGAASPAAALSSTSTQSFPFGGVKVLEPLFA